MKFEQAIVGIGLLSMMGLPMSVEAKDSKSITLKQIGRYSAGASTAPMSRGPKSPRMIRRLNGCSASISICDSWMYSISATQNRRS